MCFGPIYARGAESGEDISSKIVLLNGIDLIKIGKRPHIAPLYNLDLIFKVTEPINETLEILVWIPFSSNSMSVGSNEACRIRNIIEWCKHEMKQSVTDLDEHLIHRYNWRSETHQTLSSHLTEDILDENKISDTANGYDWGNTTPKDLIRNYTDILTNISFDDGISISENLIPDEKHSVIQFEVSGNLQKGKLFHIFAEMEKIVGRKYGIEERYRDCKGGAPLLFYTYHEKIIPHIPDEVRMWMDRYTAVEAVMLHAYLVSTYSFDDKKYNNGMTPEFNEIESGGIGETSFETPIGKARDGRWSAIFEPHLIEEITQLNKGKWCLATCTEKRMGYFGGLLLILAAISEIAGMGLIKIILSILYYIINKIPIVNF